MIRRDRAPPASATGRRIRRPRWIGPLLGTFLVVVAAVLLSRALAGHSWAGLRSDLQAVGAVSLLAAAGLTVLSYAVFSGYDVLAVRYAGAAVPFRRTVFASTLGFALSQGLGFPLLSGAPMRYRLYSRWGLDGTTVARIVAFCATSFWIGYAGLAGVVFLLFPPVLQDAMPLMDLMARGAGVGLLAALGVYLAAALTDWSPAFLDRLGLEFPEGRFVAGQIILGAIDWTVVSLVLWVLLPDVHSLGFGRFLSTFLVAHFIGMVSNVPGGLGVFEAAFLTLAPEIAGISDGTLLARLVVFRFVYYLLPLFMAALGILIWEFKLRSHVLESGLRGAGRWSATLVPSVAAALTFVLGAALVLTGSVPLPPGRLAFVRDLVPLPALEASHFFASIVGVWLLILARGLQRRLDGAYHIALVLLLVGGAMGLGHDLPWIAVPPYLAAAGILVVSRKQFYRPASLLDEPFSPSWVLSIGSVVALSMWLGIFAFKNVEYSSNLWWHFAADGDGPRFLRASVGMAVVLVTFFAARLVRTSPYEPIEPSEAELDRIAPLVAASPAPEANLVFLGDKEILLSDAGGAFLMFAVSGSSWIALGDPVGDESQFDGLLWRFRERADRAAAAPVLYGVTPRNLPLYIDLGFAFFKLGEFGRVPLGNFSLEGSARADLRKGLGKLERAGGTFEVLPAGVSAETMAELRVVSDEWLETKKAREKRFSLGRFDPDYLVRFPIACIRLEGRIVAFSNLWCGAEHEELSGDLMRYSTAAPKGVMDALFAHLLLWARSEGYASLSLGMAPLSGMETHPLAPFWQRMGATVQRYGETFYNFQGLRDYKDKFEPVWEPRYLAAHPGLSLPGIVTDVIALVSGGIGGTIRK